MKQNAKQLIALVLMVTATVVAVQLRPVKIAHSTDTKLSSLLPENFFGWTKVDSLSSAIVNPEVQSQLNEIYSETVSQVYQDKSGHLIMVAIAYGDTQSRQMQVHRPEVCYASQGFQILHKEKGAIESNGHEIPVMRLVAQQSSRVEPITYWIRIGDKVVRGNLEQGFARLTYGLKGSVPDGLLFRVSTISQDVRQSFLVEEKFINELIGTLDQKKLKMLIG